MGVKDVLGKVVKGLKFAFPKPHIPQKRYLVILGVVLYGLAKAYVLWTPSPHDDAYPDNVRDAVVVMFAQDDVKNDPSSDYGDDGLRYGEGER